MAFGVGKARRLLAAALHPISALGGAIRARLWPATTGGRRDDFRVAWSRGKISGVVRLACSMQASPAAASRALEAVAAAVAEAAAGLALDVGIVGVVPGEEPLLVALAPRRDVVAPRVLGALGGGSPYPSKHVWLALPGGTYLASVVDPYRVFDPRDEEVAALVRSGSAACALTTEWRREPRRHHVLLVVYSSRPGLKSLLTLARIGAEGARDRLAAR